MRRPDEGEFLDLVYGAALEPGLWERVLEGFADLIGAGAGQLTRFSMVEDTGSVITARVAPGVIDQYFAHYAAINPLHKVPDPRGYLAGWRPRILTDEDWMAKADLVKTEFYNDFMKPRGAHSTLMVRLAAIGDEICVMNVSRPEHRGQFGRSEIEIAERMHPHLIRAFDMARRLEVSRGVEAGAASVFDRSPHGLFVLSAEGRVRRANPAGEALAAASRGLRLSGGRLHALQPAATHALDALIRHAALPDAAQRCGGSMGLPIDDGGPPLSVIVAPIGLQPAPVLGERLSVIVCVTDLSAGVTLPQEQLRGLFGLTRSEARVALALFEGLTPREAAEQIGVSFHTVRAQIASIYEKTGVSRQSELVRLMMRSVGVSLG
jgi:DNA-binding CsgD family transcriptional regulator/PAS domain-containing protein